MPKPLTSVSSFSPIYDRYPDHAALIRRLLLSKPSFRDLCEDYLLLLDMMSDLQGSGLAVRDAALDEYRRLKLDLERDIAREAGIVPAPSAS